MEAEFMVRYTDCRRSFILIECSICHQMIVNSDYSSVFFLFIELTTMTSFRAKCLCKFPYSFVTSVEFY